MNFSVILCTYHRHKALQELLDSIVAQTVYPSQILVIDGSKDDATEKSIDKTLRNLSYYHVDSIHRGLTNQRNFGISLLKDSAEIVFFLDDDVVLYPDYFEKILENYSSNHGIVGVGGYIVNETEWTIGEVKGSVRKFSMDGWTRDLGSRNVFRKGVGLLSNDPPGIMPSFSHGFSTGYLPPTGKKYKVEYFMGCAMSFRRSVFNKLNFSAYFQGYGLYEDMDFCLRASREGILLVDTSAKLLHFHAPSGRPNKFKYGKMVLRNGWYVWRVRYDNPNLMSRIKWHGTAFLLTVVRIGNIINSNEKKESFLESCGRIIGWWSIFLSRPDVKKNI